MKVTIEHDTNDYENYQSNRAFEMFMAHRDDIMSFLVEIHSPTGSIRELVSNANKDMSYDDREAIVDKRYDDFVEVIRFIKDNEELTVEPWKYTV